MRQRQHLHAMVQTGGQVMTYLTETLYRFCTREDGYSRYQQNRKAYVWILRHWIDGDDDECITGQTFRAVLLFMDKTGKAPASVDALQQWVIYNPSKDAGFQKSSTIEDQLRDLKDYEPMAELDDAVLFESLLNTARSQWLENTYRVARGIAHGSTMVPGGKKDEERGPTASIQWLRGQLVDDFTPEAPALAGKLDENTDAVRAELDSRLVPQETMGKFPLGLPHIDKNVTVGKQNLKFIGVMGMSGDGKTTLTNTICYNWLKQGAHILYVSTEHTPLELWQAMAFLHSGHPDYSFTLPPPQDWEGGLDTGRVKPDDDRNMRQILKDIKARKNLPGMLDCHQFRSWDAIVDYLTVNQKRNKYDILIVDYIGRLDVPGDQKFRDKAISAMIHSAQGLAQTFDENKGLIILTPIQVNREGNKKANAADDEATSRYDLNAISTNSEYQHDLDLCLSVWSDPDMKFENKVLVEVIKVRKGRRSPRELMYINASTGGFEYGGAPPEIKQQWYATADDVLAATTTVDAESWGI